MFWWNERFNTTRSKNWGMFSNCLANQLLISNQHHLKTSKPIEILEEIENSTWSKDSEINSENITGKFNARLLMLLTNFIFVTKKYHQSSPKLPNLTMHWNFRSYVFWCGFRWFRITWCFCCSKFQTPTRQEEEKWK